MDLAYETSGSGDVVVLLHAGIADRRMWAEQIPAFAEHFTVVTYDMRGFGESPLPAESFSPRADLAALLDHLAIGRAHVVGCSMGGATALEFGLEYPDRTASLVLVNSGAPGYVPDGGYYDPREWSRFVTAFEAGDLEGASELDVQMWVDGPHRSANEVPDDIRSLVLEMNVIALQNENERDGQIERLDPPAGTRLDEIGSPALVMVGELDMPDMLPLGEHLAGGIADARLVTISGVAHLPNMEKPAEFNDVVLGFLRGLS